MATLDFPTTISPESQVFGIRFNTQISTSTISGVSQVVEMPGARWRANLSYRDLSPTEAAELQAFLVELRGSAGIFNYGDQGRTTTQSTITGTASVGGGSTNRVVNVSGTSGTWTAGDYIQIGADNDSPELKMVVAVSGNALTIEPAIRRTDYASKPITYTNPKGEFRLVNEDQLQWAVRTKARLTDINMEFLEFF